MIKGLLTLAWGITHRIDNSFFGRDWNAVHYGACALAAGALTLLFGFGSGVGFGLSMVGIAAIDHEVIDPGLSFGKRPSLPTRVLGYLISTVAVTVPAVAVSAGATLIHQPGMITSGLAGDAIGFGLGSLFFLSMDQALLMRVTNLLGYEFSPDGRIVHK